jgi:ABC-type transport system involved in multi-copper enzyme maturation permease subunit
VLFSLFIMLFLPLLFLFIPITVNLSASPLSITIQMIQSLMMFPLFIWTFGAAFAALIAVSGAPLISQKLESGAMLILISKPIKRESVFLGKLLGLVLYNIVISIISLFLVGWVNVLRYTGNLTHFLLLGNFMIAVFCYSLIINLIFSTITISLSGIFNNSRIVSVLTILFIVYCFAVFTMIRFFFLSTQQTLHFYLFDPSYHLGNFFLAFIDIFGMATNIGRWMIFFSTFTELVDHVITPYDFSYFRTNFMSSHLSFFLCVIFTIAIFIIGILIFKKKEITT